MGLFDKLTDAAKKATQTVESKVNQAVNTATTMAKDYAAKQPEKQHYFPQFAPLAQSIPTGTVGGEPIVTVDGTDKVLPFMGNEVHVPADRDAFCKVRAAFYALAADCVMKARMEFAAKVHDYITLVELLPVIYDKHLGTMLQAALDVLTANDIWHVTMESLTAAHKQEFRLTINDYETFEESTRLTIEANRNMTAKVTSVGIDLIGGIAGLSTEEGLFSGVKKMGTDMAVESAGVAPEQQAELYGRLNEEALFQNVFFDYFNVCLTLVANLRQGGLGVWLPPASAAEEAANIFSNLTNRNPDAATAAPIFVKVLEAYPYDKAYFEYMQTTFGDSTDAAAVRAYYGYTDLNSQYMQ